MANIIDIIVRLPLGSVFNVPIGIDHTVVSTSEYDFHYCCGGRKAAFFIHEIADGGLSGLWRDLDAYGEDEFFSFGHLSDLEYAVLELHANRIMKQFVASF